MVKQEKDWERVCSPVLAEAIKQSSEETRKELAENLNLLL